MSTALTIIRVLKWLSTLGLLLTVAIGAAVIDRRVTMLLLPPFFMHTRRCRDRGLPGQHGPRGCLAEAGRGWRQPEACPGAGSSLRRASWPKPEPPLVSPPGRRRCRDQIARYRPGAGAAQPAGWPRLAGARGQPEPFLVYSA